MLTTDVLIVGGGAAGLTASLLLSSYGVNSLLVSKYPHTSDLPKAHLLYQKTLEIFHETGVADAVYAKSTPANQMRYVGWYAGLAGEHKDYGREIARIEGWGAGFTDRSWQEASPRPPANLCQNRLEPLLRARADELAPGSVRFNHQFLSARESASGVDATIEDRATGLPYTVRARYLLACDGGRTVGPQLGVTMDGSNAVATSISIHFSADLAAYARDPEVLLRTLLNPDVGTVGVLAPMGPDEWGPKSEEWVFHIGSMPGDHSLLEDDAVVDRMKRMMGLPDLKVEVHIINRWPLDGLVASKFRVGKTFILGDGAHRMPPSGGNGLNTAVQDAYNVCWKVAAVLHGQAGEDLLDTYEAERRPVAQRTVEVAFSNWGSQRFLTPTLGFEAKNSPEENWRNLRRIWADSPEGAELRRDLGRGLAKLLPSFNALNVNFGYRYSEGALVPDGAPEPASLHPVHVYQPSTAPGHSLPHAWVADLHGTTALADLVGGGSFALIAGEEGQAWCNAARAIGNQRGMTITAFTVGTLGGDWLDLRYEWMRQRGFGATGAILVRPDRFIAWRAMSMVDDPEAALRNAFTRILGKAGPSSLERRNA